MLYGSDSNTSKNYFPISKVRNFYFIVLPPFFIFILMGLFFVPVPNCSW